MPRRVAAAAVAVVAAIAVTACSGAGGSDDVSSAPTTSTASGTTPAPTPPITDAGAVTADSVVDDGDRATVRIVSQNILHGLACPADTSRCGLSERVALFMDQLDDDDCPDIVAVQEANAVVVAAIEPHLAICGYEPVWDDDDGVDRELVLTTLDVVDSRRVRLAGGFRTAFAVRLDAELGLVDVITTHLASASDDGPCDDTTLCPSACDSGAETLRECQARQLVDTARRLAGADVVSVVGGDLNATVGEPAYEIVVAAGFVDSHLAAGRRECGRGSELSCTAGRASNSMVDLTDPTSRQRRRIDYLFVDDRADRCEIGAATGPFDPEPERGPIAHPSDHTGVLLELACTAAGDRTRTGFPAVATTLPDELPLRDDETVEAVVTAFQTLFDGAEPDIERRLAHLEDGERLRETFLAQLDAAGELAAATSVRVESVSPTSATTAEVVFSVLLDDGVVFDRVTGMAVLDNGSWLVSASTFCMLVAASLPEAMGC